MEHGVYKSHEIVITQNFLFLNYRERGQEMAVGKLLLAFDVKCTLTVAFSFTTNKINVRFTDAFVPYKTLDIILNRAHKKRPSSRLVSMQTFDVTSQCSLPPSVHRAQSPV